MKSERTPMFVKIFRPISRAKLFQCFGNVSSFVLTIISPDSPNFAQTTILLLSLLEFEF